MLGSRGARGMERAHVFFSGTVQGVGFRYTVRSLVSSLAITGWVRNLSDGRVELVAEGAKSEIETLIARIEEEFGGYISEKQVTWEKATGEFGGFAIVATV